MCPDKCGVLVDPRIVTVLQEDESFEGFEDDGPPKTGYLTIGEAPES